MNRIEKLFGNKPFIIGCIHLDALPGSPGYAGSMETIRQKAVNEAKVYADKGVHALIVENFNDVPFYPGSLPPETVAAMAVLTKAVVENFSGPVGVNALRNDAASALAVAVAAEAQFIRVNVHTGAAVTDQGIIEGRAWHTLRLRNSLKSDMAILADVRVKHAAPLGNRPVEEEAADTWLRGKADGLIVTGSGTGKEADPEILQRVRKAVEAPVLVGSGITPENLHQFINHASGFIIGSWFKSDGKVLNPVDPARVEQFMKLYTSLTGRE